MSQGRVTSRLEAIIEEKTRARAAQIAAAQAEANKAQTVAALPGAFPEAEQTDDVPVRQAPQPATTPAPIQRPVTLKPTPQEKSADPTPPSESGGPLSWIKKTFSLPTVVRAKESVQPQEPGAKKTESPRKETPQKALSGLESDIKYRNATSALARLKEGVDPAALLKKYLHEKDFESLLFVIKELSLIDPLRKVYAENKAFQGSTLLHYTAMNNHAPLTKAVIDAWVDLSPDELNSKNKAKKSALMIAHEGKAWQVVDLLLERGAKDQELLVKFGGDVFKSVANTENDAHVIMSNIAWAKRFGFDINHQQNEDGDNVLHVAVKTRGPIIVSPLLQQEGIEVDAVNAKNETALQLAVIIDDVDSAKLLLDAGAKNYGSERETLLGVAVGNDSLETVNMLLARGMRADERLQGGRSALEIAEAMIEQDALVDGEDIIRALYQDSDRMADELNKAVSENDVDAVKTLIAAGVPVFRLSDENMERWLQHLDEADRAVRMAAWNQSSAASEHPDIVMMVEKTRRLQAMKSNHVKQKKEMVSALDVLKKDIIEELEAEMKRVHKLDKDISDVHDSWPVLLAIQTNQLLDKLMIAKDPALSDAEFHERQQAALKYYEHNIPDMPRKHKLWKAVGIVLLAIAAFVLVGGILFGITVAAPVVIPMTAIVCTAAGAGVFTSLISGGFFMRSPAMKRHAETVAVKAEKFVDELARPAMTA